MNVCRVRKNNLITEKEQVRRGVNQEFHERLPDNLCLRSVRHHHVHQTVEWEKQGDLRDDEHFLRHLLSTKAWNTWIKS